MHNYENKSKKEVWKTGIIKRGIEKRTEKIIPLGKWKTQPRCECVLFGGPDERGCRKTSKSTDNGIKHTVKYVDGSVFSKREDRKGIFQV